MRSLTMAIFKSFIIYRQLLFYSDNVFLQECFIFDKIPGKDPDKFLKTKITWKGQHWTFQLLPQGYLQYVVGW